MIYNLLQIEENIKKARRAVAEGRLGAEDIDMTFFASFGFTLLQAHIIAWLSDHKDNEYPLKMICRNLRIGKKALLSALDGLLNNHFLVCKMDDNCRMSVDISDMIVCSLLGIQAQRESDKLKPKAHGAKPHAEDYLQWFPKQDPELTFYDEDDKEY